MINEKAMNAFIAQAMEELAPNGYEVHPEVHGQAIQGSTSPDLVVEMPYGLKMIIETEYGKPAINDAKKRLGYKFRNYPLDVKNVIALGINKSIGEITSPSEVGEALAVYNRVSEFSADPQYAKYDAPAFQMQIVTGRSPSDPHITIYPSKPIMVSLRDLVQYAWLAAIPQSYVQKVIENVTDNLSDAKKSLLDKLRATSDSARLVEKYGNYNSVDPLNSVAGNVIGTLTSMVQLHYNLKKWGQILNILPIDHKSLWQNNSPGYPIISKIADQWEKIEKIDYKPLSTIAVGMLDHPDISSHLGEGLLEIKNTIAANINPLSGLDTTGNINGEIWQALIPDRNERAAYYTKPTTAELLANLTVARLESPVLNAKYSEICAGTGTLARAVEENIRFRHYSDIREKNKMSIHEHRITKCIQLTDINPQSVSVATANMVSMEPGTPFASSAIFALENEGGALDLLKEGGVPNMGDSISDAGGRRKDTLKLIPKSVDICCNNDPYFRPGAGPKSPISSDAMRRYTRQANKLVPGVAHGQAGLATYMHVIEHVSLRNKRPHGKVLLLSAAHGDSYEGFRRNIETEYEDIVAISTAAGDGVSMSADTSKQEMLLIGTKTRKPPKSQSVTCVNLTRTFQSRLEAKMFADAIRRELAKGKDEGSIVVGEVVGTYFRMPVTGNGKPWYALGAGGGYDTLTAKLMSGVIWNPQTHMSRKLNMGLSKLSEWVRMGPDSGVLGRFSNSKDPRGAFVVSPGIKGQSNLFLWAADNENQTTITCSPTHHGTPRVPKDVPGMLQTASNFHISRDLRVNSQCIAAAYTEQAVMGGSAWNTFQTDPDLCKAITIFLNSTYGLLIRIGYGQITDPGRSRLQVKGIAGHPIPEFDANARQIASAEFDRLRKLELRRIAWSVLDDNRAEIDRVAIQMLGVELSPTVEKMLYEWRKLMCQQSIVHGNNQVVLKELRDNGIL